MTESYYTRWKGRGTLALIDEIERRDIEIEHLRGKLDRIREQAGNWSQPQHTSDRRAAARRLIVLLSDTPDQP